MSRIFWVLLIVVGAVLLVPPLRERARPQIEFVLNPIYKWEAKNRVNELYRTLVRERAQGIPMPTPRDFPGFVEQREGPGTSLDPWSQPFFLVVSRRSFRVASMGPDRTRGTPDDIYSKAEAVSGGR